MSVRVVARIRPLLKNELGKDVIVTSSGNDDGKQPNIVKIPNPKNEAEEFSFAFNNVYDQPTPQDELFTAEGTCCPALTSRPCLALQPSLNLIRLPLSPLC